MRILYLAHRLPYPPNRGDRIRSYHTLKYLAQHGAIDLACFSDEPINAEALREMQELSGRFAVVDNRSFTRWIRAAWSVLKGRTITEGVYNSNRFRETIRQWCESERYDVVMVFCSSMAQYAQIPELSDTPVIVDLVDVDSQKWLDYSKVNRGWRHWLYRMEGQRLRRWEVSLTKTASHVTLVSEAEADLFRKVAPNQYTHSVSNGVDLDYFSSVKNNTPIVKGQSVFVGVLDYQPNVDGLEWFCSRIWPAVRDEIPDATFSIVGRNPVPRVLRLSEVSGVQVVGEVSDIRPSVFSSQIVVAPLRIARGIQNKVLEALAMSKPVIATPEAMEGLNLEPDRHVIVPLSEADWVESMIRLYRQPLVCEGLGNAGREFVERNHSWESCLNPYLGFIQSNLDSRNQPNATVRATA